MITPKISVLVAAYNHENYVQAAIESVLSQTETDFEFIACDDASIDGTGSILQSAAKVDARIHFLQNPINLGVMATSERCWRLSSGKYIAWLDTDDIYEPNALKVLSAHLDLHPECMGVFGEALLIDELGNPTGAEWTYSGVGLTRFELLRKLLSGRNVYCATAGMVRREVFESIGYFPKNLLQVHDLAMWLKILLNGELPVIDIPVVRYRVRDNLKNLSAPRPETKMRSAIELYQVIENIVTDLDNHDLLVRIFPELLELPIYDRSLPARFFLAKMFQSLPLRPHQLLALRLYSELLADDSTAEMLEKKTGFSPKDFFELAGREPVFIEDETAGKLRELDELREAHLLLEEEHRRLQQHFQNITNSRFWKFYCFFRSMWFDSGQAAWKKESCTK